MVALAKFTLCHCGNNYCKMIPKVIHYCWFGSNPLPKEYQRYIDTWRKYMPDYEIKCWDESNFDINESPFTRKAYEDNMMAFVSDYARLKILYNNGGVYFDTDVELIKPIDDILSKGGFMGFEKNSFATGESVLNVNVGLGFAVNAKNPIIGECLDYYNNILGVNSLRKTIVIVITDILKRHGLSRSDIPTTIEGITIYPWDYFCPIEFLSSKLEITENTRTIHHYSASWMSWTDKLKMKKGYYANKVRKLLGIRRK